MGWLATVSMGDCVLHHVQYMCSTHTYLGNSINVKLLLQVPGRNLRRLLVPTPPDLLPPLEADTFTVRVWVKSFLDLVACEGHSRPLRGRSGRRTRLRLAACHKRHQPPVHAVPTDPAGNRGCTPLARPLVPRGTVAEDVWNTSKGGGQVWNKENEVKGKERGGVEEWADEVRFVYNFRSSGSLLLFVFQPDSVLQENTHTHTQPRLLTRHAPTWSFDRNHAICMMAARLRTSDWFFQSQKARTRSRN